jgi:hypothetical protein
MTAFTLVIIVTIGSVFLFTYQTTRHEISRVQENLEALQDRRIETELSRFYLSGRNWDGVQPLIVQWAPVRTAYYHDR